MANVAFKPLIKIKETPAEIERIDNSELSNYKEKGVEFQAYSKVKIGEKQYKLLRQEFGSKQNVFGWTASNASLTLTINPETETKTFYITNLIIQGTVDINTLFLLGEVGGGIINLFYCTAADPDNNSININFKVPLPFTKQTLEIIPLNVTTGAPLVITGSVVINYYGYFEQKS
jgi:hypothetical protein